VGFWTSLHRLCAIPIAALLLSCSCGRPAGTASTDAPAGPGPQQWGKKLITSLLAGSGAQAPIEQQTPTPTPTPSSPELAPGAEIPDAVNVCPPETGPVTVLIVDSERAVKSAAAQYTDEPILRRDAETVIFEDGRVITSKVEEVSHHLNELGWSGRELQLLGSMPRRYASSGGGNWRSPTGTEKKRQRKRRRRRG
jgi:hypothetical protein